MVTRRAWLRRGAKVLIGGSVVTVGQVIVGDTITPAPAAEPRSVTILGMAFEDVERGSRHEGAFSVRLDFEPDGSFSLTRSGYGGEVDRDEESGIGRFPPKHYEAGTGQDLIAAILGNRYRD